MNEKVSILLVLLVRTVVIRHVDNAEWHYVALLFIGLLQMLMGK